MFLHVLNYSQFIGHILKTKLLPLK